MTVLVRSHARDLHADAVLWGIEALGRKAVFWCAGEFPANEALTIALSPVSTRHVIESRGRPADLAGVTTVWNRRQGRPQLSRDLDERDRDFAKEQSQQHLAGFLATACADAFWVNKPAAARVESNKPYQLRLAMQVGFHIPATLLSNSPPEILAFFNQHEGDIIFKNYMGGTWRESEGYGGVFVNYTSAVSREDLGNLKALTFAPGIFQQRIEKSFEARVTVIGRTIFSARIDPASSGTTRNDWRAQDPRELRLTPIDIPEDIALKCLMFMNRADIVFACFDLIVTEDGTYHFLEVNQMGQFLWKEIHLPELPLLDAMCAFLLSGDPNFSYEPNSAGLHFADYLGSERHCRLERALQ